ncbi:MAG: HpcH/HpaI aldolase family protein [Gaiellaceae bacterium]
MTSLRGLLRRRAQLVGCFQNIPAPESTEAMAFAGVDFVIVDTEHGLIGDEQIGVLLRAAETTGIAPIVRLANADGPRIGRLLDAGLAGIMVAHVRSAAEAEQIVSATRYPPLGHRSAAGSRVTGFGRRTSMTEFVDSDAAEPAVIAMIEDRVGVDNASAIAGTDGVDALFVGTSDLGMDVGARGRPDHPDVANGVNVVCGAAESHGISAGLPLPADADVAAAFESGATFVATSDVFALMSGLERFGSREKE